MPRINLRFSVLYFGSHIDNLAQHDTNVKRIDNHATTYNAKANDGKVTADELPGIIYVTADSSFQELIKGDLGGLLVPGVKR